MDKLSGAGEKPSARHTSHVYLRKVKDILSYRLKEIRGGERIINTHASPHNLTRKNRWHRPPLTTPYGGLLGPLVKNI